MTKPSIPESRQITQRSKVNKNTSPLFDAETERLLRQLTGDEYSAQIWEAENALRSRIRELIEEARQEGAEENEARVDASSMRVITDG